MTLYTKCILDDICEEDGVRVSVMSRHTDGYGIPPNRALDYDEWWKILAPPETLVGDYYKRNLPWEEFEKRYITHLSIEKVAEYVRAIAREALKKDVTLLCIEKTPEKCHRRLLAEECLKYEPGLSVVIR